VADAGGGEERTGSALGCVLECSRTTLFAAVCGLRSSLGEGEHGGGGGGAHVEQRTTVVLEKVWSCVHVGRGTPGMHAGAGAVGQDCSMQVLTAGGAGAGAATGGAGWRGRHDLRWASNHTTARVTCAKISWHAKTCSKFCSRPATHGVTCGSPQHPSGPHAPSGHSYSRPQRLARCSLQESLPTSLGAVLGSGLVLAERLGAIAGMGSRGRVHLEKTLCNRPKILHYAAMGLAASLCAFVPVCSASRMECLNELGVRRRGPTLQAYPRL
jgi:hypothetical protein